MLSENVSLLKEIETRARWDGSFTQEWATIRSSVVSTGCLDSFPGDTDVQKLEAWAESQGLLLDLGFEFGGFGNVLRRVTFSNPCQPGGGGDAGQPVAAEAEASRQDNDLVPIAGPGETGAGIECSVHEALDWDSLARVEDGEDEAWAALSRDADCVVIGSISEPAMLYDIAGSADTGTNAMAEATTSIVCEPGTPPDLGEAADADQNGGVGWESMVASGPAWEIEPPESSESTGISEAPQAAPMRPLAADLVRHPAAHEPERGDPRSARYHAVLALVVKGVQAGQRLAQSLISIVESRLKPGLKDQKSLAGPTGDRADLWSRIQLGTPGTSEIVRPWTEAWMNKIISRNEMALIEDRLWELQQSVAERMEVIRRSRAYRVMLVRLWRARRYVRKTGRNQRQPSRHTAGDAGDVGAYDQSGNVGFSASESSVVRASGSFDGVGTNGGAATMAFSDECEAGPLLQTENVAGTTDDHAKTFVSDAGEPAPCLEAENVEVYVARSDASGTASPADYECGPPRDTETGGHTATYELDEEALILACREAGVPLETGHAEEAAVNDEEARTAQLELFEISLLQEPGETEADRTHDGHAQDALPKAAVSGVGPGAGAARRNGAKRKTRPLRRKGSGKEVQKSPPKRPVSRRSPGSRPGRTSPKGGSGAPAAAPAGRTRVRKKPVVAKKREAAAKLAEGTIGR